MITSYVGAPMFSGLKDETLLAAYEIDEIVDVSLRSVRCVQACGHHAAKVWFLLSFPQSFLTMPAAE